MAENLNYETPKGSWCSDDTNACNTYGRYYNWRTAKDVCPEGWYLPSSYAWEILREYLGAKNYYQFYDLLIDGGTSGMNVLLTGACDCQYGLCIKKQLGNSFYF